MATKKELIEIIDFLTEQCVNKIVYDLNDIAFTPYMAKYEDWEGTLNPASVEVYNYYERVRSYFINQLLAKDKKELTEEEYQQLLDEYELKFVDKFGDALTDKFLDDDSEEDYYEEDTEVQDERVIELDKQIDILTEEYIKKIVDETGCKDFVMVMSTEDLEDLEDYDEEWQIIIKETYNSPQYKQAKQIFEEYVEKRKPLLLQLIEIHYEDEDYNVEEKYQMYMDEYNFDFSSKFEDYVDTKH